VHERNRFERFVEGSDGSDDWSIYPEKKMAYDYQALRGILLACSFLLKRTDRDTQSVRSHIIHLVKSYLASYGETLVSTKGMIDIDRLLVELSDRYLATDMMTSWYKNYITQLKENKKLIDESKHNTGPAYMPGLLDHRWWKRTFTRVLCRDTGRMYREMYGQRGIYKLKGEPYFLITEAFTRLRELFGDQINLNDELQAQQYAQSLRPDERTMFLFGLLHLGTQSMPQPHDVMQI
jgi:hypothetical protein